jgi:glycosyltransferase involved in cell wall biosynthesis
LGRLSREKAPGLAIATVRELHRRDMPVRLDMVRDGPLAGALRSTAANERLPVELHGHLPDRAAVARVLATADAALATCPVGSFGLAALEALACGVPVVAADRGAAHELLAPGAGLAVTPRAEAFADAVRELLRRPANVGRRHTLAPNATRGRPPSRACSTFSPLARDRTAALGPAGGTATVWWLCLPALSVGVRASRNQDASCVVLIVGNEVGGVSGGRQDSA